VVESNHAGFTGTGFVNYNNVVGSAVEFTVSSAAAATTQITFRYANGTTTNRPMDIAVNGTTVAAGVAFSGTGAWSTWRTVTVSAALTAGTNRIRATATTSNGGPNLDSLTVGAAGGDDPISDPIPQNPILSNLGLTLTEFATFPQSSPVPPPTDSRLDRHARINFLGELRDGSGRLYVPDLNGTLYFLRAGIAPSPYLDVRAQVGANFFSGRGLGSGFGFVAFHPEFTTNGRFYTTHTEAFDALGSQQPDWTQSSPVIHSVLTEWTATNPAANTFSGTRRTLLRIGFASYLHAIQQIDFNPTALPGGADYGLLYLAVGDGGTGYTNDDPQDMRIPHGKILRIDPRGSNSANGNYGIPATNPFVGRPNNLGEIYALGMRDPHRFSWDTGEGNRMFLGHIGEHDIEAVYDVRVGDNFGWSEREGPFVFKKTDRCNLYPLPADDAQYGYTYPVAAYDHNAPPDWPCTRDVGRAIVGGFVYRGSALPALRGKYVFGDLVRGNIYFTNASEMIRGGPLATVYEFRIFNPAGTRVTMQDLAGDSRVDMRFGIDRAGELYVLAKANGKAWKVTGTRGSSTQVHPSLEPNLVAYYDFEHPVSGNTAQEQDQGASGTSLNLVNGGAAMRVTDGAHLGSTGSMQARQVNPTSAGNDDWKAGIYSSSGVTSLNRFNRVQGITVIGWF
ncbi:MAG TPA: PQQ-dependent sugar dehydrogenase, partial [Vicinamibacterales bacterium]|nr:PQQ-dependent sugar dehydrogenase [Vicinamibacterales bacterium]